jgi:hypothetical protein
LPGAWPFHHFDGLFTGSPAWLQEADRRGTLDRYFAPPLTLPERKQAELEGWILGVW